MTDENPRSQFAVLYVDDEPQALKYFSKAFSKDFRILTATSAAIAWDIVEKEGDNIGVLITDQRMPGQTGVDLLAIVRKARPNIVRILTTAYAELDGAIDAVNSGAVFRYVTKPWDIRELRGALRGAMDYYTVQRDRDILLREKLSVLQRMITLDRVRAFTILAASLACRIRNSMTALKAFFDYAPVTVADRNPDNTVDWTDLWSLAQDESQNMMNAVDDVIRSTVDEQYDFSGNVVVGDVVRREVDQASEQLSQRGVGVDLSPNGEMPALKADSRMIERLIRILVGRMGALSGEGQKVKVTMSEEEDIWGACGVRVALVSDGPAWTNEQLASLFVAVQPSADSAAEMGTDLLSAFFIAHHHGGDLLIHVSGSKGPGFELLLPFDPGSIERPPLEADWLERVFTNLEAWGEPV